MAFKLLLPFVSTYRCEAGFSAMKCIKTDKRSKLEVEDDMRVAISITEPRMTKILTNQERFHTSHGNFKTKSANKTD